jgi:hypothetical protein
MGRRRHLCGSYVSAGLDISISYGIARIFVDIRRRLSRRLRMKSNDLVSPA